MEYYFKGCQEYLETLCIQHKLLKHEQKPRGKKAFIRFNSPDDLNEITNNPATNLVMVARYYGKAINSIDDQQLRQYIQIRFASYAKKPLDGNITREITEALDRAFTIMMDFLARMENDMRIDFCGPLRGMELDQYTFDEVPEQPFLLNHYGWDLTIPFRANAPGFEPEKWDMPEVV